MGAVLAVQKDEHSHIPGQHQLSAQQWSDVCRAVKISVREQQVCRLLFDGWTRQRIADHVEISNRTVRHHMEQIHSKLGVSNRVGVVLKIIQLRDQLRQRTDSESPVNFSHQGLKSSLTSAQQPKA